jgi:hypothetical protein
MFCKMHKVSQELQEGEWVTVKEEEKDIEKKHYDNVVDAIPFFRDLGGKEEATGLGGLITKIVSTSLDGKLRSIYTFEHNL